MHIKIEDQESGHTSVLCIDREAKTATILKLVLGHQNLLIQVAQSVGATVIAMIVSPQYGDKQLKPYGFGADPGEQVYTKEL